MNIEILLKEFEKIKRKGFIKAISKYNNSIGNTFEKELGINNNNFRYADFFGIELKCFSKSEDDYLTLFSLEPESFEGNVIIRIAQRYGYKDTRYINHNILNVSVYGNKCAYISRKYTASIYVNDYINLLIYNRFGVLEDYSAKWSIERLEDKLLTKCSLLAIIKTEKKYFNGVLYVKYYDINIYSYKTIKDFVDCINNGMIRISFKITLKEKKDKIIYHNHGTSFEVKPKDLTNVFDRII